MFARKVEIERESLEAVERQLAAFVEVRSTGRAPKVSGFQATAALELAVEITKRIEEQLAVVLRLRKHSSSISSRARRAGMSMERP